MFIRERVSHKHCCHIGDGDTERSHISFLFTVLENSCEPLDAEVLESYHSNKACPNLSEECQSEGHPSKVG